MARSLNPNSTGHAPLPARPAEPPRRGILAGLIAVLIGGLVSLFPLGAGALVFLDPILKRKAKPATGSDGQEEGRPFRRVAIVDALPADGTPVQVPVIADLTDAWSREPNQPIGAVYLRK